MIYFFAILTNRWANPDVILKDLIVSMNRAFAPEYITSYIRSIGIGTIFTIYLLTNLAADHIVLNATSCTNPFDAVVVPDTTCSKNAADLIGSNDGANHSHTGYIVAAVLLILLGGATASCLFYRKKQKTKFLTRQGNAVINLRTFKVPTVTRPKPVAIIRE